MQVPVLAQEPGPDPDPGPNLENPDPVPTPEKPEDPEPGQEPDPDPELLPELTDLGNRANLANQHLMITWVPMPMDAPDYTLGFHHPDPDKHYGLCLI